MSARDYAFLILWGIFHLVVWTKLFNRLHAIAWPRPLIKVIEKIIEVCVFAVPAVILFFERDFDNLSMPARVYAVVCAAIGAWTIAVWCKNQLADRLPAGVTITQLHSWDWKQEIKPPWSNRSVFESWLRFPLNESLQLCVNEKEISVSQLPDSLDGLTIAHFSDLHFTGRICEEFFQKVIREVQALEADMICVSGDLVDKTECLEWLPRTLGELSAPLGVYFVLGNHDKRVASVPELRRHVGNLGLVDVSTTPHTVETNGAEIQLCGNELPWFPLGDTGHESSEGAFRILLSHSPDQFAWAQRNQFNLVLAGHAHGGQIRFPLIGPIIAPSWHGVRYASGIFFQQATWMHVSRGVSGLHPIRIRCQPEITKLVLRKQGKAS